MRSYGYNLFWPEGNESSAGIEGINPFSTVVVVDYVPVEHVPFDFAPTGFYPEVVAAGRKYLPAPLPVVANSPITDPLTNVLGFLQSVLP